MVKATLRSAVLLGLLVWSGPSFAEVQNVKVGGEVTVRGFHRQSLRLNEDVPNNLAAGSNADITTGSGGAVDDAVLDFGSADDNLIQQLTAVNVGADLTENVSTEIRLINQRVWGALDDGSVNQSTALGATTSANTVEVSLANVTLKELFYSPLTVRIGRQPVRFGRGLVVGSRARTAALDIDPSESLAADEYSDLMNSFDAIRGTLDLADVAGMPLVVDLLYAKMEEDDISAQGSTNSTADDTNLAGINLGTKLDSMNGEVEAYWWDKRDNSLAVANLRGKAKSETIGVRGSFSPADATTVWTELAYQWGHRITTATTYDAEGAAGDDYQAWAMNLGADYALADMTWSPVVGGEWLFYSGDNGTVDPGASGGSDSTGSAIAGWEPVYDGYFITPLRNGQGSGFYQTAQSGASVGGSFTPITNSWTNQHTLTLHAAVAPIEDLVVDNRYSWFIADKGIRPVQNAQREHYFGSEWDMNAIYNYTDDVQMGASWSMFFPGGVFRNPYDDMSSQLVTTVSVKF